MKTNIPYSQISVFVVDDDKMCSKLTENRLQNIGINQIHKFISGEDCIANLHKQPDIIILDIELGKMNGIDVLKYTKANYPQTYVIMFSSTSQNKMLTKCLQLGAFDYVEKNVFSFGKLEFILIRVVEKIIEKISEKKQKSSVLQMVMSLFF